MSSSGFGATDAYSKMVEIVHLLSLDQGTLSRAWKMYCSVNDSFSLEGPSDAWIGCAIFSACSMMPLSSISGREINGNCISLTRLLSEINISLLEFMTKIRRWSEMAGLGGPFSGKIKQLERNFSVVTVVFKKFVPIFEDLFGKESDAVIGSTSRRKNRKPIDWIQIRNFTWLLFIHAKSNFPGIADDLVNSYHLLLCVINFVYLNVLCLTNARNLLNKEFPGLPAPILNNETDIIVENERHQILSSLCERHQGVLLDAQCIDIHWFRPHILDLMKAEKIWVSDKEQLHGVFEPQNFEPTLKMIMNQYHEFVLTRGDFDERIFLNPDADNEIGTPVKGGANFRSSSKTSDSNSLLSNKRTTFHPMTPLTNRRYLPSPHQQASPVTQHTNAVIKIRQLVAGYTEDIPAGLMAMFAECENDPSRELRDVLKKSCDTFLGSYPADELDFAKSRLQIARKLFWKIMESILYEEQQRIGKATSLSFLVQKKIVPISCLAAAIEITLWSYSSQKQFPQVLEILEIHPYEFYKVIELILRAELGSGVSLPREIVKHLSTIEESILEELSWQLESPLWGALENQHPPSCSDVISQSHYENPLSPTRPVQTSLSERFGSPIKGSVKRKLFEDSGAGGVHSLADENEADLLDKSISSKKNSLDLFFRKIYHLASRRIQHLADRLHLGKGILQTIFTVFERCIIEHGEILQDRHIDQIILCSVYIVCKVIRPNNEIKFMEILAAYRTQPQYCRSVYRSVKLELPNEYGDLIKFYNSIFAMKLGQFAKQFSKQSSSLQSGHLPLSPLPCLQYAETSPRRLSSKHSIFISPHKGKKVVEQHKSGKKIEFLFQQSPSRHREISSINEMISGVQGAAKRKRGLEFSYTPNPQSRIGPALSKRLKAIRQEGCMSKTP